MRKLLLAGGLCVVAFVLVPVAAASANTEFVGTCTFFGSAKINPGLFPPSTASKSFTFTKEAGGTVPGLNTCKEVGAGGAEAEVAEAKVEGKGVLSCPASTNLLEGEGAGKVTVLKLKFTTGANAGKSVEAVGKPKFEFAATAGLVDFNVKGSAAEGNEGTVAHGDATFLTNPANAPQCLAEAESKLTFEASATGKFITTNPL